jgi:hypothetical protein
MKHIKPLTVPRNAIPGKAIDSAGQAFLQIWAYVFSAILLGALGLK